jgi:hypothetical protein
MPRRLQDRKSKPKHTFLAIRVDGYEARAAASINHAVEDPRYAFVELCDDEPVYQFVTYLTIRGHAIYPEDRAGERFEFTVHGNDAPSEKLHAKLKDVQVRNDYNSPQYRDYRGRRIPVVHPVPALAFIDKNRAEQKRTVWLNVRPRLVTDMLTLLGTGRKTYISVHEVKDQRARWVRRFELQTTDPSKE